MRGCWAILLVALLAHAAHAAPRVVLVGVDGGSWSVLDPLLAEGKLPNLAALSRRGVQAELATVEPVISPVVWSSIATGRAPAGHGIGDFFGDARDLKAPTIFERLSAQGMRVGVHEFLVTWPPQALPGGFVIPGWLRRDDTTSPPDAIERAGGPGYRYDIRGLASRQAFHDEGFEELQKKAAQWNALAAAFDVEVGAVSFYALDALGHRFWADSYPGDFDPAELPVEPAFEATVQRAAVAFDSALGEIVAALPPESTVIVVSDHGFQAHDSLQRRWTGTLEPILGEAGLSPADHAYTIEGQFGYVTLRVHPGPFDEQEALLTRLEAAFAGAVNQDGERLFDPEPLDVAERPEGRERGWLLRLRQWGLRQLARWLFSVEFSDDAHAWLIVLPRGEPMEAAWPDGTITIGGATRPMKEVFYADGFTGTHDPTAIFFAGGGAIRPVEARGALSVLDVAPLVAYLAGAPIPDDVEGRLPTEWIDPSWLAAHPPRTIDAATIERLPLPVAPEGDDAELIERLRSMGYVR